MCDKTSADNAQVRPRLADITNWPPRNPGRCSQPIAGSQAKSSSDCSVRDHAMSLLAGKTGAQPGFMDFYGKLFPSATST